MKNLALLLLVFLVGLFGHFASAQLKNPALKLEGVWKYDGGSGFEVWERKSESELIGAGYRLMKFGDTLKVEDLRISLLNNNLVYSLTTHQQTETGIEIHKYNFISNKKKLEFMNIENSSPSSVIYKFGFLSKKKLKIIIGFDGKKEPSVLKLQKVAAI
jgi:hypothetical protein